MKTLLALALGLFLASPALATVSVHESNTGGQINATSPVGKGLPTVSDGDVVILCLGVGNPHDSASISCPADYTSLGDVNNGNLETNACCHVWHTGDPDPVSWTFTSGGTPDVWDEAISLSGTNGSCTPDGTPTTCTSSDSSCTAAAIVTTKINAALAMCASGNLGDIILDASWTSPLTTVITTQEGLTSEQGAFGLGTQPNAVSSGSKTVTFEPASDNSIGVFFAIDQLDPAPFPLQMNGYGVMFGGSGIF